MNDTEEQSQANDRGSLHWLGSTEEIGYEDLSDICTKRRVWWIRLTNNQLKQVADMRVIINPFPRPGESHVVDQQADIDICDGLKYIPEQRLYAQALVEAGKWVGEMVERSGATVEVSRRANDERTEQ